MNRLAILGLVVVAGLAVGVYRAKLGASESEAKNAKLRSEVAKTSQDISVMKAEEVYLSQPSRIGPIAHDKLGLAPATPEQYTAAEQIARRTGERAPEVAKPDTTAAPVPPLNAAQPAPKPQAAPAQAARPQ
jgi:cell division protein FtsL